jgi:archaellum biogenesis ATPase FlaH
MPELLALCETDPVHEGAWLIDPILPRQELVLLDGAAGVGKTMALCNLASTMSVQPNQKVVFVSSPEQKLARSTFLKHQERDYTKLGAVEFNPTVQPLDGKKPLHQTFVQFITETIYEHAPKCLMIDGLDEMLSPGDEADTKLSREFWQSLRTLAHTTDCTILVSRSSGMHESRTYGAFTKAGTDLARFILTMHWHPESMDKRLLNVAKHQFGPIGRQAIIQFENKRATTCCPPDMEDYVKPAKSPQCRTLAHTLGKNTPLSPDDAQTIVMMDQMKAKGISDVQLFELFERNGYARERISRLVEHRAHMTMKETTELTQMFKHIKAAEKLEKAQKAS